MAGEQADTGADAARLGYLAGDTADALLEPFDQAELDALMATLADPSTWEEPSPVLRARVLARIAEAVTESGTAEGPADARMTSPIDEVAVLRGAAIANSGRRRWSWVGPAVLGAAAATLIAVVVARDDNEEPAIAIDATIELIGTDLAPDVRGTADIDSRQSGVWIRLDLPGLERRDGDDFYEAWLRSADGEGLVPIGTFHDGSDVILWAGVAIEDYPIITVTKESVAGPQSLDQGSSGDVVAKGQLAP